MCKICAKTKITVIPDDVAGAFWLFVLFPSPPDQYRRSWVLATSKQMYLIHIKGNQWSLSLTSKCHSGKTQEDKLSQADGRKEGGGSVRWRIWNWMTDVTWLLVNYPAGAPLQSGWETCWRLDYQFGIGKTRFESIVSFQAGWQLHGSHLWLSVGVGSLALTLLSPSHQFFNKISYQAFSSNGLVFCRYIETPAPATASRFWHKPAGHC